jgi:type IV pilus assembly protein PilO
LDWSGRPQRLPFLPPPDHLAHPVQPGSPLQEAAMFAKLSPRDTFLIVFALCLLVVAGWWFLYYQSKQQVITDTQTQLDDSAAQLAIYRSDEVALPKLREEVAGLQTERENFFSALPQTQNIGNVVADIRTNVEKVKGDLTNMTVTQGAGTGLPAGVRPLSLNLSVNAAFLPTFKLLKAVESMSRFSTISALSLNLPAPDKADPTLNSTLTMTVYTFDPTQAGAVAGGTPSAPAAPATAPAGGIR